MSVQHHHPYIGSRSVSATSGETIESTNPATEGIDRDDSLSAIDHYTKSVHVGTGPGEAPY